MSEPKHISVVLQQIKESLMQSKGERKDLLMVINKHHEGYFTGSCSIYPHLPDSLTVFCGVKNSFAGAYLEIGELFSKMYNIDILSQDLKIELNHVNG